MKVGEPVMTLGKSLATGGATLLTSWVPQGAGEVLGSKALSSPREGPGLDSEQVT